jgi:hypothetical protein
METISNWSYVDLEMSRIMTKLLKADFEAVAEMIISLTSADARRAVIRAAAAVALTEDDLRLYDATLKVIQTIA